MPTQQHSKTGHHGKPRKRAIPCAVLLVCAAGLQGAAHAQAYIHYDGSKSSDYAAAVGSWANAAEFQSDWGLAAMNAQHAYARGFSGAGVKVGAVDSGYLPTHQEFAGRGVTAVTVSGTYLDAGRQGSLSGVPIIGGVFWRAGDAFNVTGVYHATTDLPNFVGINDNHGNHVSGTIAAGKNGVGMMGVAFGSQYYTSNSNGTDSNSDYGSNLDYNYFKAAYGNLAAAGVRVTNTSWGSPPLIDNYQTLAGFTDAYTSLNSAGKKTWLDAAADVAQQYGMLNVWAAGNAGTANVSTRAGLPYFRPELEKYWVAVTGLTATGGQVFNQCGVAKYWCVAAPGERINSASIRGDDQYQASSGTSMSAPHVTGALGVLMERYPYLGNEEVRTILLTTASHRGTGAADVPNEVYGWGVPDLEKGLEGPAQLLGRFTANLPQGTSDTWTNGISEAALQQRRAEEAQELADWATVQAGLTPSQQAARAQRIAALAAKTDADYRGTLVKAGAGSLTLMGSSSYSGGTQLQAGTLGVGHSSALGTGGVAVSDAATLQAAADGLTLANALTLSGTGHVDTQAHSLTLAGNIGDGAQAGALAKDGAGALTLTGANSYSGGTTVNAGTLRAGSAGALVQGGAYRVNGGTLDIGNWDLKVSSLSGTGGRVQTHAQRFEIDQAGDTRFAGSIEGTGTLVKRGSGTLALMGASAFNGGTALKQGALAVGHDRALGAGELAMDDDTTLAVAANGLTLANPIRFTGTTDPTIDTGAFAATLTGGIRGAADLTKTGTGTLTLGAANNSYSGATTVAQGTLRAGAAQALSPTSAMTVAQGAVLDVAGFNQNVASIGNAGTVNLRGATPGTVLTVTGPWRGQGGTLALGTALGADNSATDKLLLQGAGAVASGITRIAITNLGGLGARTTGQGIEVVGTEDGGSVQGQAFMLAGPVAAGAYEYRLDNAATGAYLSNTSPTGPASSPDAGVPLYRVEASLLAALPEQIRQANLGMLAGMHRRMGDAGAIRAETAQGWRQAWGRVLSVDREIAQGGTVSPVSAGRLTGFQAGTDLWAQEQVRAGVYVGQLDGDMKVRGFARGIAGHAAGRNDLRNQYLGGYATFRAASGLYVDGVLQAGRHRSTFSGSGASAGHNKGSSLLASVEVGQAFGIGGGWSVEPQAQLVHQRLSLDDASIAGARVTQDTHKGWAARLGVRVAGALTTRAGTVQPYARVDVWRTSRGTDRARFMTPVALTDIAARTGGTSTEAALGAHWQINPRVGVYGELGRMWASGGGARTQGGPNASVGVKVRW